MCWKVQCDKCELYTWAGCGQHKEQVMSKIPINQRCICNKQEQHNSCQTKNDDIKIEQNSKTQQQTQQQTPTQTHQEASSISKVTLLCELTGHEERIWCCSWSPTQNILATTSSDKTIKLWSRSNECNSIKWKCIQTLDAHTRTVRCIAWNPSGNLFASASFDGSIGIWRRLLNGIELEFECIDLLEGHDNEIKSLSWDCSGKLLASCSRDKSVWIWELDDDDINNTEFEVVAVKRSHDGDVKCVKWHPFEQLLTSCSYDDTIKLYKNDAMEDDWFVNQVLKTHKSTVWNLTFNPLNGKEFATCSDDESIIIWQSFKESDINDQEEESSLGVDELAYKLKQSINNVHDEAIYHLDWLCNKKDGVNVIASCSGDNSIKFLQEIQTMKMNDDDDDCKGNDTKWKVEIEVNDAHKNDVNWIEFGPRIRSGVYLVASASDDGTIKIWQFETKVDVKRFMSEDEVDYNDIVNEID